MIHPHTELRFISEEKGYGVVATQFIPRGTITWAFDPLDRIFNEAQLHKLPPTFRDILHKYCYRDHEGQYVLCWDHARFVNHSFQSNCISTAYNLELAVRDIYPGEELTDDYGYLNVTEPLYFPREAGSSRTAVMPDDLLHYHVAWDAQLRFAFRNYNRVKQPLAFLIEEKFRNKVNDVAAGTKEMDSILNCYYAGGRNKNVAA
jgi:uncharacterized protein